MIRFNKLSNIGSQLIVAIIFVTFFMIITLMQFDLGSNFIDMSDYQCMISDKRYVGIISVHMFKT